MNLGSTGLTARATVLSEQYWDLGRLRMRVERGKATGRTISFEYMRDNVSMRAWFMDSYEGVEKLRLGEVPDPRPGPGQVLLQIRFAALNPADAFLAQAQYPAKPPLPHILGRDGVGQVVAVGAGVENVKVGDTVGILRCDCGVEKWGTLAQRTL